MKSYQYMWVDEILFFSWLQASLEVSKFCTIVKMTIASQL